MTKRSEKLNNLEVKDDAGWTARQSDYAVVLIP